MKCRIDADLVRCMAPRDKERLGLSPIAAKVAAEDAKLEKKLMALCRMILIRRGVAVILHVPNAASRCKGMEDLPDLMFALLRQFPEVGNQRFRHRIPCAVELKTARGKLSEGQRQTLAALASDGWITAVIRDAETFLAFLDNPLAREWPKE